MYRIKQNAAFTIIELLVVISIIALLVSLLLPTLSNARDAAQATRCLSQVRQYGMSHQMYATDHSGWVTPVYIRYNWPSITTAKTFWPKNATFVTYTGLEPDISGTPKYPADGLCPESRAVISRSRNMEFSYGMNLTGPTRPHTWNKDPNDTNPNSAARMSSIQLQALRSASDKMLMADALSYFVRDNNSHEYTNENTPNNGRIAYRHQKQTTVNLGFYDGHGETRLRESVDRSFLTPDQRNRLWRLPE